MPYVYIGACFTFLALAELIWPARRMANGSDQRIAVNFGLGVINILIASAVPVSAFLVAEFADMRGWGLFNLVLAPVAVMAVVYLLAHSLTSYTTHRMYHWSPLLWRVHQLHHSDDAIDLSTGLRGHPLEMLINAAAVAALVLLLGPPAWLVILIDTALYVGAFWQHANLRLPERIAARLEWLFITPRLHFVHHANDRVIHDSNYGDIFSIWDRLLGTLRTPETAIQPGLPHPFPFGVRGYFRQLFLYRPDQA